MKLDRLALVANQLEGTIPFPKGFRFTMSETYSSDDDGSRGCILGALAANFIETEPHKPGNVMFLTSWEIIRSTLVEEGENEDEVRDRMMCLLFDDQTNDAAHQAKRIRHFLEVQGYAYE